MKKVTVILTPDQERRLGEVSDRWGSTKAEVIRRAIGLLHTIVEETEGNGNRLQLVEGDDGSKTREVIIT
jgi:hypothetical protein